MIAYASRTGIRRNLAALRAADWRLMVSAKGVLRTEGFRYALDNGAWWSFQNGQDFDEEAFALAYGLLGRGADFVVLPDIIGGGEASLAFSLAYKAQLERPSCWRPPMFMLAVQDGMTPSMVRPHVGPACGIFVGGTTDWKVRTLPTWGSLAREVGTRMHVGRVNTARRIAACHAAGAHSFDGSSASRYAETLPLLDNALRQPDLLGGTSCG